MKNEILIYIFVPYAKDAHSHVLHRATLPFCCTPVSPTEISISKVHNIECQLLLQYTKWYTLFYLKFTRIIWLI